jgi:4-aminobutyrate aminotransferase
LPYGSFFAPYPYAFRGVSDSDALDALDMLVKQQVAPTEVAAVLIEPVLGEGGYVPASPAFLQSVRAFCDAHGALLIADEVQCGVGRTGAFYACETSGVVPDVLVTAKGLASGYPLSAVATSTALASTQPAGCMGGTYWRRRRYKHFTDHGCKYRRRYGGNAVACAAAVATLDVFETEDVLENVAARSAQAAAALDELAAASDVVADVRAPGLMIGVEFADVKGLAGAVARECEKRGLLVLPTGVHEAVRLIPPLTVTEEDMADALDVFAASVRAAASVA